jgi:uroporphyrinogen decarboxylase
MNHERICEDDMTSLERIQAALRFEKPDRVPFNFWMDRRLLRQYELRYGPYFRVEHYGADVIESPLMLPWPSGEALERDGTAWMMKPLWNEGWQGVNGIAWPNPEAPENFTGIEHDLRSHPDKAIFVNVAGITGIMHGIRSEADLFTDFCERPGDVQEIFAKIGAVLARAVENLCARCPAIAAIYVQDDVCSSHGCMFSPDTFERFIYLVNDQPIRAARAAEIPVVYHSDGKTDDILEHLIGLGVSAINPLQPTLHDFNAFMRRFGGRIGVYGALDNCFVIPDGTPEEIREHVLDAFHILGSTGALILSSHDIPSYCPHENIEVMVKTIREDCLY